MYQRHITLLPVFLLVFLWCCTHTTSNHLVLALEKLVLVYPDHIKSTSENGITWTDGTYMALGNENSSHATDDTLNNPTLADQLKQPAYNAGTLSSPPQTDPGRVRFEPFFRKMYGNCEAEVERNLEQIEWMPRIFGKNRYLLLVTNINNIHEKIKKISDALEQLVYEHPEYAIFLNNPGGTYCWRTIAHTNRLSAHSFGMTLDINASHSHYWQWDLQREKKAIDENAQLTYLNIIPWEIVTIFEQYGFIWGGKWYHYDTMHFEYRPELFSTQCATT